MNQSIQKQSGDKNKTRSIPGVRVNHEITQCLYMLTHLSSKYVSTRSDPNSCHLNTKKIWSQIHL